MKAIITVGISASGKTTWAEEYCRKNANWININRDSLRFSLFGLKDWSKYKFTKAREGYVTKALEAMVQVAAGSGRNIILSDTNLNKGKRDHLQGTLTNLGYHVKVKDFPITIEEAWKRDALRANGVGHSVIAKQWAQWLGHTNRIQYTPSQTLPQAIIFDVDGTLAKMEGRGPHELSKVDTDSVHEVIADMARGYHQQGYRIIVMSGREGTKDCALKTGQWLYDNVGYFVEAIYMRREGDRRKDSIIKEQLFWEKVAPNYAIMAVVDDRPQMTRAWRDMGLKVIDVGNPYIEF